MTTSCRLPISGKKTVALWFRNHRIVEADIQVQAGAFTYTAQSNPLEAWFQAGTPTPHNQTCMKLPVSDRYIHTHYQRAPVLDRYIHTHRTIKHMGGLQS